MVVYRGLPSFRANSFGRFIFVFNIFSAVPAKSEHGCLDARNNRMCRSIRSGWGENLQKKLQILWFKPWLGCLVVDPLTGASAQTEVPNSLERINERDRERSKRKGPLDLIFRHFDTFCQTSGTVLASIFCCFAFFIELSQWLIHQKWVTGTMFLNDPFLKPYASLRKRWTKRRRSRSESHMDPWWDGDVCSFRGNCDRVFSFFTKAKQKSANPS